MTSVPDPIGDRIRALANRLERAEPAPLKVMLGDDASILAQIFVNRNLDGWTFDGEDLEDVDFSGASLVGTTFRGAKLRGARFDRTWIERWRLYEAADWRAHVLDWTRSSQPTALVPHRLGERFAEAPFAPELVMLPPAQLDGGHGLDPEEADALAEGRLAMAALPLTVAQVAFYELHAEERHGSWSDDGADRPCAIGRLSPTDYARWLGKVVGGDYRVPSSGLWEYAARAGATTDYPWGSQFDRSRAITAELARSREWPSPIDTRQRPGEGRCNEWGLFDVVGNLREVTREIDPADRTERVCLRGGSYRLDSKLAQLSRRWYPRDGEIAEHRDVGLRLVRLFPRESQS